MAEHVFITAHSGCDGTPDNTLESVEKGIALGADCVEVDVRMGSDGRLWLTHDLPDELTGLVPLRAALERVKQWGGMVNCDLKTYDTLYPVLELARECGLERDQLCLSGSVKPQLLLDDRAIAQRAQVLLNVEELLRFMQPDCPDDWVRRHERFAQCVDEAAALLRDMRATALNAPYQFVPCEMIPRLREAGMQLSLWTINDAQELRAYLAQPLFNITTRRAELALRLRSEN